MKRSREEKLARNLSILVRQESNALRRMRWVKRLSYAAGWILLLLAFSFAFQEPSRLPVWVVTFAAATGGCLHRNRCLVCQHHRNLAGPAAAYRSRHTAAREQ